MAELSVSLKGSQFEEDEEAVIDDTNEKKEKLTPLVEAILFSPDDQTRIETVRSILNKAASPADEINAPCIDHAEITSMHAAIEICDFDVLELLLSTPGAEPKTARCMQGGTLFHWYAEHGGRKGEEVSRRMCALLFDVLGADVIHATEEDGETPIFWARSTELQMRILLDNGARADDKDVFGASVMIHALRMRAEPVVQLLYDALKTIPGATNELKRPEMLCNFIKYLPDSDFLLSHLDSGVHFIGTQPNGDWFYQFNIGMVEPRPGNKWLPLHFIVEKGSRAVSHPLVQAVLQRKWRGYVQLIYTTMLLMQLLRVSTLSWAFSVGANSPNHSLALFVFLGATLFLFVQEIIVGVGRTFEGFRYGWRERFGLPSHFTQPENLTQVVDYVLSISVVGYQLTIGSEETSHSFDMLRGIQFFLCLFATIFFLSPLEHFGSLVVMLSRVLFVDLPPFIVIGGILVTAFAGLSQTITGDADMPIPVWTTAFVFGPDQLMEISGPDDHIFFLTSIIFALAVPIALLNLMIASFSYTYQTIVEEVKVVTQLERARLITDSDVLLSLFGVGYLPCKLNSWQQHLTKAVPGKLDLLATRSAELSQEAKILARIAEVQEMLLDLKSDLASLNPRSKRTSTLPKYQS